jgi:hypothetical protein
MAEKQGKIFVNSDEHTLADTGFKSAPDARIFAQNLANWFSGGKPAKLLVCSFNFGLRGSSLHETLKAAGHTVTIDPDAKLTKVEELLPYDAVFLADQGSDNKVLIDYVNKGGGVYLACGVAGLNSTFDAQQWSTFLDAFGLKIGPIPNVTKNFEIPPNAHPVLHGVKQLYFYGPSPITNIAPASPATKIIFAADGMGLLAVFDASLRLQNVGVSIAIVSVNPEEQYVELKVVGGSYNLSGHRLLAFDAQKEFVFREGTVITPDKNLRVYTDKAAEGAYSLGSPTPLWKTKEGKIDLWNPQGRQHIIAYPYDRPPSATMPTFG